MIKQSTRSRNDFCSLLSIWDFLIHLLKLLIGGSTHMNAKTIDISEQI